MEFFSPPDPFHSRLARNRFLASLSGCNCYESAGGENPCGHPFSLVKYLVNRFWIFLSLTPLSPACVSGCHLPRCRLPAYARTKQTTQRVE